MTKPRIEHGSIWRGATEHNINEFVLILWKYDKDGEWYSWVNLGCGSIITGGPNDTRGNLTNYRYAGNIFMMLDR